MSSRTPNQALQQTPPHSLFLTLGSLEAGLLSCVVRRRRASAVVDLPGLQERREQRSFAQWDEFVAPELVALSEVIVRQLIDRLIALGMAPSRDQVQEEITRSVRQYNGLNRAWQHPWICTIEREDICLVLERLAKLCGFSASEDWAGERDW